MPRYIFDTPKGQFDVFPSLAENKSFDLSSKLAEKKDRLVPQPLFTPNVLPSFESIRDGTSSFNPGDLHDVGNLVDAGQSSLIQAGGSLADLGRGTSNKLFNTNFNTDGSDGFSDQSIADEVAGVDPLFRQNLQAGQHAVGESVAEGDFLGAALNAAKVAIPTAVDSTASLAEIGVGAALTAVAPPLGGALFLDKARRATNKVQKAKKVIDDAKAFKEATLAGKALQKAAKLPGAALKASGQVSLLVADMTQQQIDAFRTQHGEMPSAGRVATAVLTNLVTSALEPTIISKLFIPNVKKEFVKEGIALATNIGVRSNLLNIAKRAYDGTEKLLKAGAAEAAQEYFQTWQEILVTDISPKEADDLRQAISERISDKKFIDQATTGGFLGGAAGGATKLGISTPAIAAGTAVDLTKATTKVAAKTALGGAKVAGNFAQDSANKAGLKVLSEEDRAVIKNQFENDSAVVDEKVADFESNITKVTEAETLEDILKDKGIAPLVKEEQRESGISDDDLQDPKALKSLKDKLVSKFKADQDLLKVNLEATNVGRLTKKGFDNVKDAAVKKVDSVIESIPEETIVKTILAAITVKEKADATIKAVKGVKSSAARGVINLALESGKDNISTTMTAARDLNLKDLKDATKVIKIGDETLGKRFDSLLKDVEKSVKRFDIRNDDLITKDTLSPVIKDIANVGTLQSKNFVSAAQIIRKTLASKIMDKESLADIKKAIEIYKASEAFTDKTSKGRIDSTNMAVFERRLESATTRLNREITVDNLADAVDSVSDASKQAVVKAKEKLKQAKELVSKVNIKRRLTAAKKISREEFDKVKLDIDNEKAKILEDEKTAKRVAKEKETTVPKETLGKVVKRAAQKGVEAAKDSVEVIKDTTAEVVNEVTRPKVVPEGKAHDLITKVAQGITEGAAEHMLQTIPSMVKALNKLGFKTENHLADLFKQFPGLKKDPTFLALLEGQFATNVITKDQTYIENVESDVVTKDDKDIDQFRCKK